MMNTRFKFGVIIACLMTVSAILAAFFNGLPYIPLIGALGGVYVAFTGSKAITDKFTNGNGKEESNGQTKISDRKSRVGHN